MCHMLPAVTDLYVKILENKLSKSSQELILYRYQEIVGSILILVAPLSPTSLQCLLDVPSSNYVPSTIQYFSFIISSHGTHTNIRVQQPSFRHFISNPNRCPNTNFLIDLPERHTYLTRKCFSLMKRCFSEWSFDNDLACGVEYAICHWKDHLCNVAAESHTEFLSSVEGLFRGHFSYWLEALHKAGRSADAIPAVKQAIAWVTRTAPSKSELILLLSDVKWCIPQYYDMLAVRLAKASRFHEHREARRAAEAVYIQLCELGEELKRYSVHRFDTNNTLVHMKTLEQEQDQIKEALELFSSAVKWRSTTAENEPNSTKTGTAIFFETLGLRLSYHKHWEAAYDAGEQCLVFTRSLFAQNESHQVSLGWALYNFSIYSEMVEKIEDAQAFAAEAVELRKRLQITRPNEGRVELANALYNHAIYSNRLEKPEQALQSVEEAILLYRALAAEQPDLEVPKSDLVNAVINRSTYLDHLERSREALESQEEALALCRRLVEIDSATHSPALASCIYSLSRWHESLGDWNSAISAVKDSLALYLSFSTKDPMLYQVEIANCHFYLAIYYNNINDWNQAIESMSEALVIYRKLRTQKPEEYLSDVADSLSGLGRYWAKVGEFEKGLAGVEEGMKMARPDPVEAYTVSETLWAYAQNARSMCLHGLGRLDEAMRSAKESLHHFRPVYNKRPGFMNYRRILREILETNVEVMESLDLVGETELLKDEIRALE